MEDIAKESNDEIDLKLNSNSGTLEKGFEFIHKEDSENGKKEEIVLSSHSSENAALENTNKEDKSDDEITKENIKYTNKQKSPSHLKSRPSFKKDKIDAHYDKLPWVAAAAGRVLGLNFAPMNIPLERRIQTFAVFLWMSIFLFMGFGSLYLLLYIFFYTQYWWLSFSYLTFFLADRTVPDRGGRRSNFVRNMKIWKHFANFFPMKIIKTVDYDPDENYIFGYHPHGILSAGALAHFGSEGTNFSKLFPGLTPYPLTLPGHFNLPLYRDCLLSAGVVSASKTSLRYLLTHEKKGRALGLVVGGAPESLYCHPGDVYLYLKKRKGFCKYALEFGANLVPTFSFGENAIYDQYPNPPGSLIRTIQDSLQKMIGLAPCLFLGRGVFQYSFGIIPFRKPINTVFGPPIKVEKVSEPTPEQVNALHTKYVRALKKLYDEYKDQFAEDPNDIIVVV